METIPAICICPQCGLEIPRGKEISCSGIMCPRCIRPMRNEEKVPILFG